MFDVQKFGRFLSKLRKQADMTQSELADQCNLTRQAISRYEVGDSFPDVSVLVLLSDIFQISLDELIAAGNPTHGESKILADAACGRNVIANSIDDIMGVAPYLKPSVLAHLSAALQTKGIDISSIVRLAEYINDESVVEMLRKADFSSLDDQLFERFIPLLDDRSKVRIFQLILEGEMDWHMLRVLLPHMQYMYSQVEVAVLEGCLPWEALGLLKEAMDEAHDKAKKAGEYGAAR